MPLVVAVSERVPDELGVGVSLGLCEQDDVSDWLLLCVELVVVVRVRVCDCVTLGV